MNKTFASTVRAFIDTLRLLNLKKQNRQIAFYSEGKNYWPHLAPLLESVLSKTNSTVSYISSALDDPGLRLSHQRYSAFYIGEGYLRNHVFLNFDFNSVVMTMPDLNRYQVKRSRHDVHYIYVPHSLVSLHMCYKNQAFQYYDTICCAGPHHVREIEAMSARLRWSSKNIIELGFPRLDSLIKNKQRKVSIGGGRTKIVLIAPSWGPNGMIESRLCLSLIADLIQLNYSVILRPHPQTIKFNPIQVREIIKAFETSAQFKFEESVDGEQSLHNSNLMISDWSGAAIEYALALNKPVIFCNTPKKINNPNYADIEIEPVEVFIRDQIGLIWDGVVPIKPVIEKIEEFSTKNSKSLRAKFVFNQPNRVEDFVNFLNHINSEKSKLM
ncbi:CDP-glycerol glycerophosphotransferase family protein [Alphaproteobacteria bacterium]|nr:CDP-glycerol glycerophosphotransferase family protein [Alphaproteobacteria bacterium]